MAPLQWGSVKGSIIATQVSSFSANTAMGTVVNLAVQGSLILSNKKIPVLLATEFIPGTSHMEGTLTLEGLPTLVHLPLGQAFITPKMAQTINTAGRSN